MFHALDFRMHEIRDLCVCRRFIPVSRHEKCNCAVVSLKPFFEYNNRNTRSELVSLVANGERATLEGYLEDNSNNFRIIDRHGNSPIHIAIILDKMDIFDYLLTIKFLKINPLNRYGQTPMHLAAMNSSDHFIKELLKRGGDVNLGDSSGCTPLHAAAARYSPKVCEFLLENGAVLNYENSFGKTPLYHACEYGTVDSIYMLLYHGASAKIADMYGVLPLTAAMQQSSNCHKDIPQSHLDCHEVLFNCTFDKEPISLNLSNLTAALKINSPLIPQYLSKIYHLKYSTYDLKELCRIAVDIHPKYFKLFMRKFGHVVKEMLFVCPQELQHTLTGDNVDAKVLQLMEFLSMIFRSRPTYNFIKGSTTYSYIIGYFVGLYKERKLSKTVLDQVVYFMYSYGLPCELDHITVLYETFGFSEIVKFLLDFDVILSYERPKTVMPYLMCDINITINSFLGQIQRPSLELGSALKFFVKPEVRNFFGGSSLFRVRLRKLPTVPSLIELSRDVAREHIIKTFQIHTSRDFYRILKQMQINEVYKKIITFETEIYRF